MTTAFKRLVAIGVSTAAVLGGAATLRSAWRRSAAPVAVAPEPSDVEAEIQALRTEVAALRAAHQTDLARAWTVGLGAGALGSKGKVGAEPEPKPRLPTREAVLANLESRARSEPRDVAWADPTERKIDAAVQALSASGVALKNRTCFRSFCRLELAYASQDARLKTTADLVMTAPFNNTRTMTRPIDQGGELSSLVYVAREGASLVESLPD
jgi:hypothetical protein